MGNELNPLKRMTPEISYIDIDDVYVHIPTRNKDSIHYCKFIKSHRGQFDPIELRWFITNNNITDDLKSELNRLNLYDGLKYKYRADNPFYNIDTNHYISKFKILKPFINDLTIGKQIKFDRRLSVQFFSTIKNEFVLQIIVDKFIDDDYENISTLAIHQKILRMILLPLSYGRANWKHYAAKSNVTDIRDINVSGLQKICDSF